MGYKSSTFLLVIKLVLSFFLPFPKIVNASDNSNEELFHDLYKENLEDISFHDDIWALKNFIEDLSLLCLPILMSSSRLTKKFDVASGKF